MDTAIPEAVERLIKKHGSLRAAARAINEDHGYLSRLKNGRKTEPSDAVLAKLGLERVTRIKRRNSGST